MDMLYWVGISLKDRRPWGTGFVPSLLAYDEIVDCVWNVMAHAQTPNFIFRRNGRAHLNRRGRQFSRILAAEVCASAVVMLNIPCSVVVWRVLATHSIRQFPLHFRSRASPCAITFQLDSTSNQATQIPSTSVLTHYTIIISPIHGTQYQILTGVNNYRLLQHSTQTWIVKWKSHTYEMQSVWRTKNS
jgi:hypothetical protein